MEHVLIWNISHTEQESNPAPLAPEATVLTHRVVTLSINAGLFIIVFEAQKLTGFVYVRAVILAFLPPQSYAVKNVFLGHESLEIPKYRSVNEMWTLVELFLTDFLKKKKKKWLSTEPNHAKKKCPSGIVILYMEGEAQIWAFVTCVCKIIGQCGQQLRMRRLFWIWSPNLPRTGRIQENFWGGSI